MKFNNLESAKSELNGKGLNLPTEFENRELNEKEATKFNWYVVVDTSQTMTGRSAKTIMHLSLQSFDARRLVSPSVKDIIESSDAILIHDMNKKDEAPKRGRSKKEDTNETDR